MQLCQVAENSNLQHTDTCTHSSYAAEGGWILFIKLSSMLSQYCASLTASISGETHVSECELIQKRCLMYFMAAMVCRSLTLLTLCKIILFDVLDILVFKWGEQTKDTAVNNQFV